MRFSNIFKTRRNNKSQFNDQDSVNNSLKNYGEVTCIPTVLSSTEECQKKNEKPTEIIRELSLLELGEIDWSKFGARLKQEQLLPPSYDRIPTKVTIGLSKKNKPKVELVFSSKTSDSYRTIMICNDNEVFEYTNGAINQPTRTELVKTWRRFKEHVIYGFDHDNINEANEIKKQGQKLKEEAELMMNIETIFEEEKKFLENHKNDKYEFFGYMFDEETEIPFFVAPEEDQAEGYHIATKVTPFTPKTLEFCVSKLNDDEKYSEAEDQESLDFFIKKCEKIASYSIYTTNKWEKTINLLVQMLTKHAEEYRLNHHETQ